MGGVQGKRGFASREEIARRRARILEIVRGLPGAEIEGDRHLGFTVRGKRFAWYLDDHHGDARVALHCKAGPGDGAALVEVHPERYHVPAYLGSKGWLGLWLDLAAIDWDEVAGILRDAYCLVAPKGLSRSLADRTATSEMRPPARKVRRSKTAERRTRKRPPR